MNEEEFKIDSNAILNPSDYSRRKSPDRQISKSPIARNDESFQSQRLSNDNA